MMLPAFLLARIGGMSIRAAILWMCKGRRIRSLYMYFKPFSFAQARHAAAKAKQAVRGCRRGWKMRSAAAKTAASPGAGIRALTPRPPQLTKRGTPCYDKSKGSRAALRLSGRIGEDGNASKTKRCFRDATDGAKARARRFVRLGEQAVYGGLRHGVLLYWRQIA